MLSISSALTSATAHAIASRSIMGRRASLNKKLVFLVLIKHLSLLDI